MVPMTAQPGGHILNIIENSRIWSHTIFSIGGMLFIALILAIFFFFPKRVERSLRRQVSQFHWSIRSHSYWHSPPLFMLRFPQHSLWIVLSVRIHIQDSRFCPCFSAFWQRLGAGYFYPLCVCVCVCFFED